MPIFQWKAYILSFQYIARMDIIAINLIKMLTRKFINNIHNWFSSWNIELSGWIVVSELANSKCDQKVFGKDVHLNENVCLSSLMFLMFNSIFRIIISSILLKHNSMQCKPSCKPFRLSSYIRRFILQKNNIFKQIE